MHKVLIIAEAGVNHNGSLDIAKKLVDVAYECGADICGYEAPHQIKLVVKMLSKEEIICKATKKFGEYIGEIEIEKNIVLFRENEKGELYSSDFEDLFDESLNISYGDTLDTIIVDLTPKKLDINEVFEEIKTKYAKCDSLISLTKEKEKIVIVVERFKGWGKSEVIGAIGNKYPIKEYENSDGDWEITISLEFDICNATPSEIKERLRGHFDVISVMNQANDTIAIIFEQYCDRHDVCARLNLPSTINECCYDLKGGKYLFVLNKAQIRDMRDSK